jgi:hypothetical protein
MTQALVANGNGAHLPAAPASVTPMDMLDRALAQGAGIDVLEKLMALQERWEANSARKEFNAALASAKAEMPVITKNRTVDFTSQKGRTNYRYEDLAGVVSAVTPVLAKHGLWHRFRTTSLPGEPITVTCIIGHSNGHTEENTLCGPPDLTGNKNSIQAVGSTITYLQRMTLKAALGLAASEDDDGQTAGGDPEFITAAQVAELEGLLKKAGRTVDSFCQWAKVESLSAIYSGRFDAAKRAIATAANRNNGGRS